MRGCEVTKVTNLKNRNEEPVEAVVEELETALAQAKSGKLRSVAMVGTMVGNETYTAFANNDIPETVGSLELLKWRLIETMISTRKPVR